MKNQLVLIVMQCSLNHVMERKKSINSKGRICQNFG